MQLDGVHTDVEAIEIRLLLDGILGRYGYDFREYAPASLRRRLLRRMEREGVRTVSALQERVLHDRHSMEQLLFDLSVTVTAMFRDPAFFLALRSTVVPLLRTYPFIRIWNAGCSTGEETLSLAILLLEEGLYDRARIYATDINESLIKRAQAGIFPLDRMRAYTANYIRAGGARAFSEYYVAQPDGAHFDRELTRNIVFAQHNLVSDGSFNEFHLVVCRNVMIYFARPLQDRVHRLFYGSLVRFGVLALGQRESLRFTVHEHQYEELDAHVKIYRRVS